MNSQQSSYNTKQTTLPVTSIDTQQIIEHGESPTAIILAVSILISILLYSITRLVQVVVSATVKSTDPPR
jgi:hypothetical protein